jgi:hypothetical protein
VSGMTSNTIIVFDLKHESSSFSVPKTSAIVCEIITVRMVPLSPPPLFSPYNTFKALTLEQEYMSSIPGRNITWNAN